MKTLKELVRPDIYSIDIEHSVRNGCNDLKNCVLLDMDENPYNSPYNRYSDQSMTNIKILLSKLKRVPYDDIYIGNGRDSLIDVVTRCFCRPKEDNVVTMSPSYAMYGQAAEMNGVECRKVLLDENFQLSADAILDACDENTKIIWLCSPNVISGNVLDPKEISLMLEMYEGLVVIDESYSDFNKHPLWRHRLGEYPNLAVVNTMDNSWGCASVGVAMLYANSDVVDMLEKFRCFYKVDTHAQRIVLQQLREPYESERWARSIAIERQRMVSAFKALQICVRVYPSEANFLLVEFVDAQAVYNYLLEKDIIVKDCSKMDLCHNCLCITIGSKLENNELLAALRQY